jgi:hypothetical protein
MKWIFLKNKTYTFCRHRRCRNDRYSKIAS